MTDPMTLIKDALIEHMTRRFLEWKLPSNFNPDNGISATRPNYHPDIRWEPVGTNLLSFNQTKEMVQYLLDGTIGDSVSPLATMVPVDPIYEKALARLNDRLTEQVDSGMRTMGGGSLGGPDGPKMWGGEPIMKLRNPDGPEAAELIKRLLEEKTHTSNVSKCNRCGAFYKSAPVGTTHKCGKCSDGYCAHVIVEENPKSVKEL